MNKGSFVGRCRLSQVTQKAELRLGVYLLSLIACRGFCKLGVDSRMIKKKKKRHKITPSPAFLGSEPPAQPPAGILEIISKQINI